MCHSQGGGGPLVVSHSNTSLPPPPPSSISKLEPKFSDICIEEISLWPLEALSATPHPEFGGGLQAPPPPPPRKYQPEQSPRANDLNRQVTQKTKHWHSSCTTHQQFSTCGTPPFRLYGTPPPEMDCCSGVLWKGGEGSMVGI